MVVGTAHGQPLGLGYLRKRSLRLSLCFRGGPGTSGEVSFGTARVVTGRQGTWLESAARKTERSPLPEPRRRAGLKLAGRPAPGPERCRAAGGGVPAGLRTAAWRFPFPSEAGTHARGTPGLAPFGVWVRAARPRRAGGRERGLASTHLRARGVRLVRSIRGTFLTFLSQGRPS